MIHLHNHTEYSLLDGASRIKDLINTAKSYNMPAVAITDHGNLYGAIEFYKACKQAEVKPIIGCEFYYAPVNRFTKDHERYHLILLCKDEPGYKNMIKLISRSYSEGYYYKPRIDWELLEQHHEGLICLSGCIAGEIPRLIQRNKEEDARTRALAFRELFGPDFYLELQDHGLTEEARTNPVLLELSKKYGIPLVATNDTHYISREDAQTQEILLCIGTKDVISNPSRFRFPNNEFYFKSPQEMEKLFYYAPEALANTEAIAEKCNLDFEFGKILLPRFPVDDPEKILREKAYAGLKKRFPGVPDPKVIQRLNYELKVIIDMGFADYFLIVQDIVNWAKSQGIPVGPGRGSAAGSLVSYLLGITELNPLEWGLIFERFLSSARISMPDIDTDVCYRRRDEVINYITERYGKEHVAQIITFGTMAAKAAIRDVGRVMEVPLEEIDQLAKRINSLENANHPTLQHVIDTAKKIEDMPRHTGVHAAGVIIGPEPLTNIIPTQVTEGQVTTQYEMFTCEDLGLLKMDILGLKTLTIIDDAVKLIRKRGIEIDINKIPLDDPKVYRLLSNGYTIGIFQVESEGMQRILKKLKPDCFEDLIAVVALYRPGPLGSGMVDDFIDRKHGIKKIEYLHPILEPILQETYGIILYQEQTMKIATGMAGFSMSESDTLRKGIGKKIPEVVEGLRKNFIEGSIRNGIPQNIAEEVFSLIDYFSGYGFNKSHSAAYAFIAYQTAYLKAHYPIEFMAALLSNTTDQDKIAAIINDCRRLGIKILPPDINKSGIDFTIESGQLRFGLGVIKNLGDANLHQIISNRPYNDIYDLIYKAHLNKAVLEVLIKSGCLSQFGTRKSLLDFLPTLTKVDTIVQKEEQTLFGTGEELLPEIPYTGEYPLEEILAFEKESLGFYVSSHPLDDFEIPQNVQDISTVTEGKAKIAGIVTSVKSGVKNGSSWYFATVEDYTGQIGVLVFDKPLKTGQAYMFQGKTKLEEDSYKLFAYKANALRRKSA